MAASVNIWKNYGAVKNKFHGDSWFARLVGLKLETSSIDEHLRTFPTRNERDDFIKDQNQLIKQYGFDEYAIFYKAFIM